MQQQKTESKGDWLFFAGFLVLCYFPIFHQLGTPPIKGWDEGLFGMRALYLAETGEVLPAFSEFPGYVTHLNIKPPLFSWIQAQSLHLLEDVDVELALRLPIALCVLGTVLILLLYSKRVSGRFWWGMIASLVLITSEGYIRVHVARTADHDAALAFLMLGQLIVFLKYLSSEADRQRYVYLGALVILLLMAFWTKNVIGFLFLPGFLVYAIFQKQLLPILKRPSTYVAIVAGMMGIGLYYLLMNEWVPQQAEIIQKDTFNRFSNFIGAHDHPFDYYFKRYYDSSFRTWIYFIPLGAIVAFSKKLKQFDRISQLAVCCAVPYLLVISSSVTKLPWYDAAMYPLLSIVVATGLYQLGQALWQWTSNSSFLPNSTIVIYAGLFLFLVPYTRIVTQFADFQLTGGDEIYAYLMKRLDRKGIDDYYLLSSGVHPQPAFYTSYFNWRKEGTIKYTFKVEERQPGDLVMYCQGHIKARIDTTFTYTPLENYKEQCYLLRLDGMLSKGEAVAGAEE